jgi:hypothetical protein
MIINIIIELFIELLEKMESSATVVIKVPRNSKLKILN